MKNILYIHQYFKTPEEGGAIRSYHIAQNMVSRGYHVDMVTCYSGKHYKKESIDGIVVHYLPIAYSNNFSFIKRSIAFLKYAIGTIILTSKLSKPDLVFATSTPLTVGLVALWLKWTKHIPYIFEVRDLWPEAPIQLGIIKMRLLKYILRAFEKKIYQNADHIIALSPGIKKGVMDASKNAKVAIIPNMSDLNFFSEKQVESRRGKPFQIGYFGAFGMANNTAFIMKLALICKQERPDVEFLLVGEGSQRRSVEMEVEKHSLQNVKLMGHVDRHKIRDLMTGVDACITTFLNVPVLQTNSPNKFFDGLAAAKLMIVNTEGWLKELVTLNQCGFYIDPEKPEEFISLIIPYLEDQELLRKSQNNALELAREQFSKEQLVEEVCDILTKYAGIP